MPKNIRRSIISYSLSLKLSEFTGSFIVDFRVGHAIQDLLDDEFALVPCEHPPRACTKNLLCGVPVSIESSWTRSRMLR